MHHIKHLYRDKKIAKENIRGCLISGSHTGVFVVLEMIFGEIGLASQIHK